MDIHFVSIVPCVEGELSQGRMTNDITMFFCDVHMVGAKTNGIATDGFRSLNGKSPYRENLKLYYLSMVNKNTQDVQFPRQLFWCSECFSMVYKGPPRNHASFKLPWVIIYLSNIYQTLRYEISDDIACYIAAPWVPMLIGLSGRFQPPVSRFNIW